jgi:rare lipoprotein A
LSGKHAEAESPRLDDPKSSIAPKVHRIRIPFSSRVVPLLCALLVASVVVAASVTAMTLGPATDADTVSAVGSPSVTAAASGRGSDERASRSGLREIPSASPSSAAPTPSPKASTKKPVPPSGGGTVTSSGTCGASYYTGGGHTANGEVFNTYDFTAAHRTLPFNTRVRVTNVANGKSTVVRINDRGPFVSGRCLDLTQAAFGAIASLGAGVITVKYEVLS